MQSHVEIAACTMAKREREEEFEVSEVAHPSSCASVKGVVKTLSPMKKSKSCSYFDGEISDGKASMRLFGFDSGIRTKLLEYESKKSISLVNCEVKQSRQGQQLEVIIVAIIVVASYLAVQFVSINTC